MTSETCTISTYFVSLRTKLGLRIRHAADFHARVRKIRARAADGVCTRARDGSAPGRQTSPQPSADGSAPAPQTGQRRPFA